MKPKKPQKSTKPLAIERFPTNPEIENFAKLIPNQSPDELEKWRQAAVTVENIIGKPGSLQKPFSLKPEPSVDDVKRRLAHLKAEESRLDRALEDTERARDEAYDRLSKTSKQLIDVLYQTWEHVKPLNPWDRHLVPFKLDMTLCKKVKLGMLHVTLESEPNGIDSLVVTSKKDNWWARFTVDPQLAEPSLTSDLKESKRSAAIVGLTAALLAIYDLLTREIQYVGGGRPVRKTLSRDSGIARARIDYDPIIYAPKTITVRVDPKPEPPAETAAEKAERERRERVKHRVPAFRRNRRMSVKQQKRLLELMAQGYEPIDRFGKPIPFPKNGEYTIVLEHERGTLEPEVVSRSVLNLIQDQC